MIILRVLAIPYSCSITYQKTISLLKHTESAILFDEPTTLVTLKQAALWAQEYTKQLITLSNIEYLIRFGYLIPFKKTGGVYIDTNELRIYYDSRNYQREQLYKEKLGDTLHWHLSFDNYKERETTKHVHRLHPYKGKYIPQLVEYLLDEKTDQFKNGRYFRPGDIILDPFCGSGTTLVQANEMGMRGIGIDVSQFNCAITNAKLDRVSIVSLMDLINQVDSAIEQSEVTQKVISIESELGEELSRINSTNFNPKFMRHAVRNKEISEETYSQPFLEDFKGCFQQLTKDIGITNQNDNDKPDFLSKWFLPTVLNEIMIAKSIVEQFDDSPERNLLRIILSRTVRSARSTKHDDLATLVEPCYEPYYCRKHYKICKPLLSLLRWWRRYAKDTVNRITEFNELRTNAAHACIQGDSRTVSIPNEVHRLSPSLSRSLASNQVAGIVTSPPYVGIIDYHEQHAYAYELFNLERVDELEIGPLFNGSGTRAKKEYGQSMIRVFTNCNKVLKPDCNIFVIVNDKFDLYPDIIKASDLRIHNRFERPVLNRAEGNRGFYSESIFHLKKAI